MPLPSNWLLKRCLILIALPLFLLISHPSFSQQKKVFKGSVTDKNNMPLDGASITVKGLQNGVNSKADGTFSIEAAPGSVLVISSVGYLPQEITLKGPGPYLIHLETTEGTLNDVVVVGYGSQRKKDLTGSVATVNMGEIKKTSASDVGQLLQGRVAGISVTNDGQPGSFPSIRIRGVTTFGNQGPLYVVDGVMLINPPRDFSPNDIESMQV